MNNDMIASFANYHVFQSRLSRLPSWSFNALAAWFALARYARRCFALIVFPSRILSAAMARRLGKKTA
ncbi:MAG: hypothetical protein LBD79_10755 [Treponema sp.]|jgi:hypothetical protein|nr:hypothetical protein [Treponema sp.]